MQTQRTQKSRFNLIFGIFMIVSLLGMAVYVITNQGAFAPRRLTTVNEELRAIEMIRETNKVRYHSITATSFQRVAGTSVITVDVVNLSVEDPVGIIVPESLPANQASCFSTRPMYICTDVQNFTDKTTIVLNIDEYLKTLGFNR